MKGNPAKDGAGKCLGLQNQEGKAFAEHKAAEKAFGIWDCQIYGIL